MEFHGRNLRLWERLRLIWVPHREKPQVKNCALGCLMPNSYPTSSFVHDLAGRDAREALSLGGQKKRVAIIRGTSGTTDSPPPLLEMLRMALCQASTPTRAALSCTFSACVKSVFDKYPQYRQNTASRESALTRGDVAQLGAQAVRIPSQRMRPLWYNAETRTVHVYNLIWGFSSAGRAPRSQRGGRGFESPKLHHNQQPDSLAKESGFLF